MGLMGEETPQEKEERLQSREERLQQQHGRIQERSYASGSGGGGLRLSHGSNRLGNSQSNGESFLGEHKVMIMVGAGVAVLIYVLWNMHNAGAPAAADAASAGAASTGASSTGTADGGSTYAISQLATQLSGITLQIQKLNNPISSVVKPPVTTTPGPTPAPKPTNPSKCPSGQFDDGKGGCTSQSAQDVYNAAHPGDPHVTQPALTVDQLMPTIRLKMPAAMNSLAYKGICDPITGSGQKAYTNQTKAPFPDGKGACTWNLNVAIAAYNKQNKLANAWELAPPRSKSDGDGQSAQNDALFKSMGAEYTSIKKSMLADYIKGHPTAATMGNSWQIGGHSG